MTADQMKKLEKLLNEIFTLNKNIEGFAKENNIYRSKQTLLQ